MALLIKYYTGFTFDYVSWFSRPDNLAFLSFQISLFLFSPSNFFLASRKYEKKVRNVEIVETARQILFRTPFHFPLGVSFFPMHFIFFLLLPLALERYETTRLPKISITFNFVPSSDSLFSPPFYFSFFLFTGKTLFLLYIFIFFFFSVECRGARWKLNSHSNLSVHTSFDKLKSACDFRIFFFLFFYLFLLFF